MDTAKPQPVVVEGAVITPFLLGSAKAQFSCMANVPLEHLRADGAKNAIKIVPLSGARATVKRKITEPTIYAGPLFLHFGHFISESLHRLWPRLTLPDWSSAKVAFHVFGPHPLEPYMVEALRLYGVAPNDIIRIACTTRFERLCIAPQMRQILTADAFPEYRSFLEPTLRERFPEVRTGRRLYVSRLHHHHTGFYLGESYVEEVLRRQGFEVVYPERHGLFDMIRLLRSCDLAVFAEGSALHILELCGIHAPDVFVIGRRFRSIPRFEHLLPAVCSRWHIADHVLSVHGADPNPDKRSGLLNLSAVLDELWTFAGLPPVTHSHAELKKAIDIDAQRIGVAVH